MTHPRIEVSSPSASSTHNVLVQEAPQTRNQANNITPRKRIKHDLIGESSKKWKFDPFNKEYFQAKKERRELEAKMKQDEEEKRRK